jgi:hypothetical protein
MKKTFLLLFVALLSTVSYAQKSKKTKASPKTKVVASNKKVVAKADNITAEFFKGKEVSKLYLLVPNAAKADTVTIKTFTDKVNNLPVEVRITPFMAKGTKLYSVTWTEKSKVGDAKTKLEESTENHTEIFDLSTRTNVYSNTQKTTNITEIVFLDAVKVVSETQQKVRREGMELTVLPDGDLLLKNKQTQTKYTYKPEEKKYTAKK